MAIKTNKTNNPPLQPLPLRLKNQINMDNLYSVHNFAVAVNYYVLRPKTESNC